MTPRQRAAALPPAERRQRIIDAVVPLLIQHGPELTTRQIAEAAGVAEGTLFRVFPDKRTLLVATATDVLNPTDGEGGIARAVAEKDALRDKVIAAAQHIAERMERGMLVMMALRATVLRDGRGEELASGPPPFLQEANRALIQALSRYVFEPHADELRVTPQTAAIILRSLAFGNGHPGTDPAHRLDDDAIADACLNGVISGPAKAKPATRTRRKAR